jgi:hypothetical protein
LRSAKENFQRAGLKATKGQSLHSMWPVFKDFEIERVDGELFIFAPPKPDPMTQAENVRGDFVELDSGCDRFYAPLTRYPDLFVRFARLYTGKKALTEDEMLEMALGWARAYGILGVEGIDPPAHHGKRRSGRRESVTTFVREAKTAAFVLDAFEAASSDNPEMVRKGAEQHWPGALEYIHEIPLERSRDMLTANVVEVVGGYVEPDSFPTLRNVFGSTSQGWGFRSSLGAMYLQMMFYILEPEMLRWCKATDCNQIVTFEEGTAPESPRKGARGEYRTRGDKEYCSKACAERMGYRRRNTRNRAGAI